LGLPENRVRVRAAFLGGGFGAKVYVKMEALAVALSLLARRPVKVALTTEEQFFTISKHGSTFRIKSAVTKNGRITARYAGILRFAARAAGPLARRAVPARVRARTCRRRRLAHRSSAVEPAPCRPPGRGRRRA
jgi:CO/xanthine dehydrogenase Mo-binding subunit